MSKGGDGEKEKDGDAANSLPHAVAPVGPPSVHSGGGAEEKCHGGLVSHNIEYDMASHWEMTFFLSFCSQYYA